jgi:hypothetical protein
VSRRTFQINPQSPGPSLSRPDLHPFDPPGSARVSRAIFGVTPKCGADPTRRTIKCGGSGFANRVAGTAPAARGTRALPGAVCIVWDTPVTIVTP